MAVKPVKKMVIKDGGDSYIMCSPFEDAVEIYDPNKQGGYMYDDYVYYAEAEGTIGHIYHCKKNNTTTVPTDNTKWELVTVTGELQKIMERLYQQIAVSSLSFEEPASGLALMGNTVTYNDVKVKYKLNKLPQKITINGKDISELKEEDSIRPLEGSWKRTDTSTQRRITVEATDEKDNTDSKYVTLTFGNYVYYGAAGAPDPSDPNNMEKVTASFIQPLPSYLASSKSRTIEVDGGSSDDTVKKYIWYAFPSRLGTCVFKDASNNTEGGFARSIVVDNVSNDATTPYSEPYRIYRSDNYGLGQNKFIIT